ncbi:methyltransferase [Robiginitalea sp. IMCC44478]|uniref:methyltransferase n=1 Tax=Robiginitalea sp. IMCC44478 TaxID=3459122 RepID=UPI004041474E
MYKYYPEKRYRLTLEFLRKHIGKEEQILDLGVPNPFSEIMRQEGFEVQNTGGEDLDLDLSTIRHSDAPVVTAFEILEHLVAPFNLLRELPANKLLASVPLRLWFAAAYRSETDPWDRHFHEFEAWQFDWLLEKAGWEIKDRIQWAHPVKKIGVRPILRYFTPRYYLIYAERTP